VCRVPPGPGCIRVRILEDIRVRHYTNIGNTVVLVLAVSYFETVIFTLYLNPFFLEYSIFAPYSHILVYKNNHSFEKS
jgi:hypothetical protein